MIIAIGLVAFVGFVLVLGWITDRRDAPGGAGRHRKPGSLRAESRRLRQGARWRRAMTNRSGPPLGARNDPDDQLSL